MFWVVMAKRGNPLRCLRFVSRSAAALYAVRRIPRGYVCYVVHTVG